MCQVQQLTAPCSSHWRLLFAMWESLDSTVRFRANTTDVVWNTSRASDASSNARATVNIFVQSQTMCVCVKVTHTRSHWYSPLRCIQPTRQSKQVCSTGAEPWSEATARLRITAKKVDASTERRPAMDLKVKKPKVCVDSSSSVPLKYLKHLVRSLAFNPTTSWHHYVTMSQICIIYAYSNR